MILGLTLVQYVALAYYDVPDLVDKLSFALTLSSLLLAVLAIFYTIVAGANQDRQLGRLVETNAELDAAASEIRNAAIEIREFARSAPKEFRVLGEKIDEFASSYNELDQSEIKITSVIDSDAVAIEPSCIIKVTDAIGGMHFVGMAILYLFLKSERTTKTIDNDTLVKLGLPPFTYAMGLLNGLHSVGLLEMKYHKGSIIPISCSDDVVDNLRTSIDAVIKVAEDKYANKLIDWLKAIDEWAT